MLFYKYSLSYYPANMVRILQKMPLPFALCLLPVLAASSISSSFSSSRYPLPDIRHTVWPLAQLSSTQLECFTELDSRFMHAGRTYRLENSGRMANGACLVRIPTGSRLTVSRFNASDESYVLVIAGSSDLHMPLRTKHIRQEYPDRFGPWHVPCNRAYLVFRSNRSDDWVEFSLSPETDEDRQDGAREDCAADGRNFASVELH